MKPGRKLKKILVVDDDDEYNFLTEDVFGDTEYECKLIFKLKAQDALDYLKNTKKFPDLILLDINMPIMNGWEFLEEYQNYGYYKKSTLIIMTSSSVYEEDEKKAKSYTPVIEYIGKPLTIKDIERIHHLYFS